MLMLKPVLKLRSHAQRRIRVHGGYKNILTTYSTEHAALRICSKACKKLFYSNTEATKRNSLVDEDHKPATIHKQ